MARDKIAWVLAVNSLLHKLVMNAFQFGRNGTTAQQQLLVCVLGSFGDSVGRHSPRREVPRQVSATQVW